MLWKYLKFVSKLGRITLRMIKNEKWIRITFAFFYPSWYWIYILKTTNALLRCINIDQNRNPFLYLLRLVLKLILSRDIFCLSVIDAAKQSFSDFFYPHLIIAFHLVMEKQPVFIPRDCTVLHMATLPSLKFSVASYTPSCSVSRHTNIK